MNVTPEGYFKPTEIIVNGVCAITQNYDRGYFRNVANYQLTKLASTMRCVVITADRGVIPVNMYLIGLAGSGYSKGHSLNIIRDNVIETFRDNFIENTLPAIADKKLFDLATKRSIKTGSDFEEELKKLTEEYRGTGEFLFNFDSGTSAAFKQQRHKGLLIGAGALSFEMDEIAKNMTGNQELLTNYLETFDVGVIGTKLIKNTKESVRVKEIHGAVPTNMMLFGTHDILFDGSKLEKEFDDLLVTGYARRCFFSYVEQSITKQLSAEEIYNVATDPTMRNNLAATLKTLGQLADMINFNKEIYESKEQAIRRIQYMIDCQEKAKLLGTNEVARKAELSHRYFKATKLAGTYAFIVGSHEITEELWNAAVLATEDSGKAFERMMTRDKSYVRLAKYLSNKTEVTQADMVSEIPWFKGTEAFRRDQLTLAIAWGYKNNTIIKKNYLDGIEFLSGESLKETDLSNMIMSIIIAPGDAQAAGFEPRFKQWNEVYIGTQIENLHWCNHHFLNNYRQECDAIPRFNMLVLDIDEGIDLATAKLLMKDYTYLVYITKRHTSEHNRFRLVMPISHELNLNAEEYKEFMYNVVNWLPFKTVDDTHQRSKKWLANKGHYEYNEGILLDALQFIPKTSKAEEKKKRLLDTQSLSNIERWFVDKFKDGNRSNQMIKYALLLVDSGLSEQEVQSKVLDLNEKLSNKLDEGEIHSTIFITVSKAIQKRN
jgi:hypothetical protein